jgi:hypothetical protein
MAQHRTRKVAHQENEKGAKVCHHLEEIISH